MTLTLRSESPADIASIHALTRAAFLDAPHAAHTEHFIVDALREAGALTLSLVAVEDDLVVGHVAVSPITISGGVPPDGAPGGAPGWYGLGPLSVLPQRQHQGIGSKLMQAALRQLQDQGAAGCVLAGNPAYYSRFGFVHQNRLVFPALPAEFFLVRTFSAPTPLGVVAFHEAFATQGDGGVAASEP